MAVHHNAIIHCAVRKIWHNTQGSVLLEFILCIPFYFFLWASAMYMFDLYGAKFAVLEANRNLSWSGADRFSRSSKQILSRVSSKFASLTSSGCDFSLSNQNAWAAKMNNPKMTSGGGMDFWPENRWSSLYAGNVQVKMSQPGFYIGMLNIFALLGSKVDITGTCDLTYDEMAGGDYQNPSDMIVRRSNKDSYHVKYGKKWSTAEMETVYLYVTGSWHTLSDTAVESQPELTAPTSATAYTRICDANLTQ